MPTVMSAIIDPNVKSQLGLVIGQLQIDRYKMDTGVIWDNYICNLTDLCKTGDYWTFNRIHDSIRNWISKFKPISGFV